MLISGGPLEPSRRDILNSAAPRQILENEIFGILLLTECEARHIECLLPSGRAIFSNNI
jgi:hypothetical protein